MSGQVETTRVQKTNDQPPQVEHDSHELGQDEIQSLLQGILGSTEQTHPSIAQLQQLVGLKYQLIVAYISYGDQLRSYARDGIHGHFQTHIEEERQQAYELNKKLTALGVDAPAGVPPVPPVDLSDPSSVFQTILQLEESSVHAWQALFDATAHDAALNGMAQNGALQDQQHADDMRRYLRSEHRAG